MVRLAYFILSEPSSSNQATTLESQTIHRIQYVPGRTLRRQRIPANDRRSWRSSMRKDKSQRGGGATTDGCRVRSALCVQSGIYGLTTSIQALLARRPSTQHLTPPRYRRLNRRPRLPSRGASRPWSIKRTTRLLSRPCAPGHPKVFGPTHAQFGLEWPSMAISGSGASGVQLPPAAALRRSTFAVPHLARLIHQGCAERLASVA